MPHIISPDQTAYLNGRQILDNVLCVTSTLELAKKLEISGYMAFLDCEKAFDRLNHEYLVKVLLHCGFGETFVKYIKMLISGFHALLTINGF